MTEAKLKQVEDTLNDFMTRLSGYFSVGMELTLMAVDPLHPERDFLWTVSSPDTLQQAITRMTTGNKPLIAEAFNLKK